MGEYAYRGVDDRGRSVRVAATGDTPQHVLLNAREAGHSVVMLYELIKERTSRYEKRFTLPNFIPPQTLGRKSELKQYHAPRKAVRAAIKNGLIKGQASLLHTRVDAGSLLEHTMNRARAAIFGQAIAALAGMPVNDKPAGKPDDPAHTPPTFESVPLVAADETFVPPEGLRKIAETARAYNAVPYEQQKDKLVLLATAPTNLNIADDLSFMYGMDVVLARCHENADINKQIVIAILKQDQKLAAIMDEVHSSDYLLATAMSSKEEHTTKVKADTETWEGSKQGLPPLPVLDSESSRAREFLGFFPWDEDLDSCPLVRLCKLIAVMAGKTQSTGFRVRPIAGRSIVEYLDGDKVYEMDKPPFLIHESIVITLAGAAGISPTQLPPAHTEFELTAGTARFQIAATTQLLNDGEQLDVRWRPAQ